MSSTKQSAYQKFITAALDDFNKTEVEVETFVQQPDVAPFVPLLKTAAENFLLKYGVQPELVEAGGEELLTILEKLLSAANAMPAAPVTPTNKGIPLEKVSVISEKVDSVL